MTDKWRTLARMPMSDETSHDFAVQALLDELEARDSETQLIFDPGQITAVYQPIVDLETREVIAAEALVRWPGLSITPDVAFEYARDQHRVDELDLLCQKAAIEGATSVDRAKGFKLFVNVEPGNNVDVLAEATREIEIVVEITERALLHNPAELLRSIRQVRERGCGIALDDVGAVPDSLALLPFVAPDVIKLDISLVQAWPNDEQARILTAVADYAERSGATILAEGIETEAHLDQAQALGATLGQGWYFSRPGPLAAGAEPSHPIPLLAPLAENAHTPFELLDQAKVRTASKGMLLAISRHIEQQGLSLQTPPLVLAAFQDHARFTTATASRYRALTERCPFVVALGAGMQTVPTRGVRGADLAQSDDLRGEWTVVVVGAHYTGALIARDLGDTGPDLDRRYEFVLTHDSKTVLSAARILLGRIDPVSRYEEKEMG
jgi:EAL domain-containing protein (putative c-di-GMP-specific phosphodiesterase class I)